MREIKFRGKRVDNGKWVYGWYAPLVCNDKTVISNIRNSNGTDYRIIPETIGQFTGLCDKNGNEIYEGDIVSKPYERGKIIFNRIGYDGNTGLSGFVYVWAGKEWVYERKDYDTHEPFYECNNDIDLREIEVVGNIHDNPELLEEVEE